MKIPWLVILIVVLIVFLLPDPVQWRQAEAPTLLPPTQAVVDEQPPPQTEIAEIPVAVPTQPVASTPIVEASKALGQGVVNTHNLYLRMGPGTDYQALRLMPQGLTLDIHGRSNDGKWLEVRLPDGTGGWAAAEYVDTDLSLTGMPVSEAHGGLPAFEPAAIPERDASGLDIEVSISGSQAVLSLHNFPANTAVGVAIRKAGKGGLWTVAHGTTDATGAADLSFLVPDELAGEGELTLTASTDGGSFNRTASVQYLSQ